MCHKRLSRLKLSLPSYLVTKVGPLAHPRRSQTRLMGSTITAVPAVCHKRLSRLKLSLQQFQCKPSVNSSM
jgi:hypothetical protein